MRQNALRAAQARRKGSVPPKATSIEMIQDRKPFLELVNKIRGSEPASEVYNHYLGSSITDQSKALKLLQVCSVAAKSMAI